MIKAVFFDFDGVLSDSKKVHDASWIFTIKKILGVTSEMLPHEEMSGKSPELIAKTLCKLFAKDANPTEVLDCKNDYLANNLHNIKSFEGVEELLTVLKSKNIPFGIASNASKFYVKQCLINWNINVAVSYGYEDYKHPKPHPEAYLKLAKYFNIALENHKDIIVFEDSGTGLKAALDAKMQMVYIESHCSVAPSILNEVDYCFDSVKAAKDIFKHL